MATPAFKLPAQIPRMLAFLRDYYDQQGESLLASVLGEGSCSVEEETFYDNWDGGIYGHDVRIELSATLFGRVFDKRKDLEDRICKDLNAAHNSNWESVTAAHLELGDDPSLSTWLPDTGAARPRAPAAPDTVGIWHPGLLRLFISHKAGHRVLAGDIKREALSFGVSCFVAHDDIEPSDEWQREIERGLATMEALLALLTPDFHDSDWTDQEVGAAIGRGTVIVPVALGLNPYGFAGKFQALPGGNKSAAQIAEDVVRLLVRNPRTRTRACECLVVTLENARGYVHANQLVRLLEDLQLVDEQVAGRIAEAAEKNDNVAQSWVVRHRLPKFAERFGWSDGE